MDSSLPGANQKWMDLTAVSLILTLGESDWFVFALGESDSLIFAFPIANLNQLHVKQHPIGSKFKPKKI